MKILGIDPGLCNMGWGIIECQKDTLNFIASGTLKSHNKYSIAERLKELYNGLSKILKLYMPNEVAIETIFVNKNAKTSLKLGHARGIALLASAKVGLSISEYYPNVIKKSVTGLGRAKKKEISNIVHSILEKSINNNTTTHDSSDALATAICHANHKKYENFY